MNYLLDTNVISDLRRPDRASIQFRDWTRKRHAEDMCISVVSVLEIEEGIRLKERQDKGQGLLLREWFERNILTQFEERILPVDIAIARRCAGLHVPNQLSYRDAFIAATALVHDLILVTRNVKDFHTSGAKVINPWD